MLAGVDAVTTSQKEADQKRGREMRKAEEERGKQVAPRRRALPQRRAAADRQLRCGTPPLAGRYFLDTEYNGWGGGLLSLALVPDHGEELYLTLGWEGTLEQWVERNVLPYLDTVPPGSFRRG